MQSEIPDTLSVLMSPNRDESVTESMQSGAQTNKIGRIQGRKKSYDMVARLRNSWPGRIYTRYLKKYVLVRWSIQWIWRNGYLFHVYVRHFFARRLSLTKLSNFVRQKEIQKYKLTDATVVVAPAPTVFPLRDQGLLVPPNDRYRFPEVFVVTITDAMIYGGTNLIPVDDEVICHDLYDFERDYTSEELHGRTLIDTESMHIRWLLHDKAPAPIPVAAAFVDACASNYAHWMTEVLPRIAMFCAEDRFHGVPIVVNDGLHENIMESLFLTVGDDREIITIPIGRALAVGQLYLTSVTGYVPFEQRTTKLSDHSHGMFSPQALELLRNKAGEFATGTLERGWPEKVFLRRNSGVRVLINMAEIEQFMVSRGYVVIEPEKLTFLEQSQLFRNAKDIVAPTGAALANAIFCKPGTRVVVLMAKHDRMIYRYWHNMLTPLRIMVGVVLGNPLNPKELGIHSDYTVNPEDVVNVLEAMEDQ